MSDTIQALNEVVFKCSEREEDCGENEKLLEEIVVIAGDCLEDHVKAADRAKPRKERTYKEIVRQIAGILVDDPLDTPEGTSYAVELIQEVLETYRVKLGQLGAKLWVRCRACGFTYELEEANENEICE